MKLIIMTKPTFFVEEDKILTTLFEEGMDCLHLYKPGSEPIYAERLLTLLPEDYHKRIVVHDHFYLRGEYGLRGIHLNLPTDQPPIGYRGHISRTCHSFDEIPTARKHSDYVFLSTVFDGQGFTSFAASNPHAGRVFSYDELADARRQGLIDRHVYALGGVSLDNIRICRDLGFGGVVVCGDLWNRFDIHRELDYKELIAHFQKLRKAVG
ncbi:MAG: thiamine phosphate synthase [Prevotella sp.]|nr:thiamine phosphate synthase [Prevotella sp.]